MSGSLRLESLTGRGRIPMQLVINMSVLSGIINPTGKVFFRL